MKRVHVVHRRSEVLITRIITAKYSRGRCPTCVANVDLIDLDSAVNFTSRNTREIFRLIDLGSVHAIEAATGHLRVCGDSLKELLTGELK